MPGPASPVLPGFEFAATAQSCSPCLPEIMRAVNSNSDHHGAPGDRPPVHPVRCRQAGITGRTQMGGKIHVHGSKHRQAAQQHHHASMWLHVARGRDPCHGSVRAPVRDVGAAASSRGTTARGQRASDSVCVCACLPVQGSLCAQGCRHLESGFKACRSGDEQVVRTAVHMHVPLAKKLLLPAAAALACPEVCLR